MWLKEVHRNNQEPTSSSKACYILPPHSRHSGHQFWFRVTPNVSKRGANSLADTIWCLLLQHSSSHEESNTDTPAANFGSSLPRPPDLQHDSCFSCTYSRWYRGKSPPYRSKISRPRLPLKYFPRYAVTWAFGISTTGGGSAVESIDLIQHIETEFFKLQHRLVIYQVSYDGFSWV